MPLEIVRVDSVRRAAEVLAADPRRASLAAARPDAARQRQCRRRFGTLVLSDGLGLDRIEIAGRRATIGAGGHHGDDRRATASSHSCSRSRESIGGPAVRTMATVGGNLFAR